MTYFDYILLLGDPERFHLTLTVTATSRAQAVEKANQFLAESGESHSFSPYTPVREGHLTLNEDNLRVTETDIVQKCPCWLDEPAQAIKLREESGYDWSGSDSSPWPEMLDSGQGHWMKPLQDDENQGIYGFLKVNARPDINISSWAFKVGAWLYPGAMWRCDEGGDGYRVELSDAFGGMNEDELLKHLESYERKFADLIYVLREADPEDGFPLSVQERQQVVIRGF